MSRLDAIRISALLATLASTAGCSKSHPCGDVEFCDEIDNDCDGRVDETFRDGTGVYNATEHCGACGLACADVFPNSAETRCEVMEESARCVLVACAAGFHPAGAGACVPDVPVLCLPCGDDADCDGRGPSARCVDGRCLPRCAAGACPAATHCVASGDDGGAAWPDGGADSGEDGLCVPDGGDCDCNEANVGLTVPCVLRASGGAECAGVRMCGEGGFAACEPALGEQCNGADDDCDGEVDEDFKNEAGVYATAEHCGACASPCAAPGPNMVATCDVLGVTASCEVTCEDGFVDVDGIPASGCECERWDGMGPPPVVGGDTDCDGVVDDATDFVYVTTTGSDSNAGSLAKPMRTVPAAIARAASLGRDVLVAAGVYDGKIALTAGVSVFGGYRQDFRDRDVALYPVVLERSDGAPGEPVIVCTNIQATTRIEGVTVVGSDAVAEGEGSSAVFADGCGSGVTFASIELYAGAGADGRRGADSSENLAGWGLSTLGELDGADGTSGRAPTIDGCPPLAGGSAGAHTCPQAGNVGGGAGGQATCPGAICTFGVPCANGGCTDFTSGGVCDFEAVMAQAVPNPPASAGHGVNAGAPGTPSYNAPTNRGVCNFCDDNLSLPRFGIPGGDGAAGVDGGGGAGCGAGPTLTVSRGTLSSGNGTHGTSGTDGSGGGGGSAGSGYLVEQGVLGCSDRSGGSGGGGGSGGCGAPSATGGSGGGLSTGFVVRTAGGEGPGFVDVRIVTAAGGRGGDGGVGANGGAPGLGAAGGQARFWCSRSGGRGGDGGRGGASGGGGGGCGGGVHGVVILGANETYRASVASAVQVDVVGVPGKGGRGGFSPGAAGGRGGDGASDQVLRIP